MGYDVTMIESDFWRTIAILKGRADEEAISRLIDHLAEQGEKAVRKFADELARAVHALDTPAHFKQPVRDESEPAELDPLPMSSDVFLYARLAVVASGRQTYERVLADPAALAGTWPVAGAEDLLGVAEHAYERTAGDAWEHELPVSMETGSNAAAWGTNEPDNHTDDTWITLVVAYDVGFWPRVEYARVHVKLEQALKNDPEWKEWWAHSSRARLEVYGWLTLSAPTTPKVRRGRAIITVEHDLDARPVVSASSQELSGIAVSHAFTMLDHARSKLKMPPLPSMPAP